MNNDDGAVEDSGVVGGGETGVAARGTGSVVVIAEGLVECASGGSDVVSTSWGKHVKQRS